MEVIHCKRSNGTDRAWFNSKAEAEAFAADPNHPVYFGDVAALCGRCKFWHLDRSDVFGICAACGGPLGMKFFTLRDGETVHEECAISERVM